MTLVITTCTNRKRKPVSDGLYMSSLPQASVEDLANKWVRRLAEAPAAFQARDIYGGRSFQESILAADLLDARLMVVSAGLGLIFANEQVPPYACTVLVGADDSIRKRVVGANTIRDWWQALSATSPYRQPLRDAAVDAGGMICTALSDAYIEMIADELCALPVPILARLRIFTRAPMARIPSDLRDYVMPYDDRLDGPDSGIRGTRGDFAARALRHFAEQIVIDEDNRSASEHADAVSAALRDWRMSFQFDRRRLDDAALLDLIRSRWDAEFGSTTRLLRWLRDDLYVACEQGRFGNLARQVRGERA